MITKSNLEKAINKDKQDTLSNYKKKFYFPQINSQKQSIYFSGNSLGLQPNSVEKYILDELDKWKHLAVNGHNLTDKPWLSYHENLTILSSKLVGANKDEVVVMNSLTVNLHLLMVSFYRPTKKRKKILIEKNAFPSDVYAVQSQLKFHGNDPYNDLIILEPKKNQIITNDDLSEILQKNGNEIALVLLGGVNYYTGQAFDMEAITQMAHNYGCIVGFDLAHATGNLKLELHKWGVDFAAWCGYKYLNGGPGAPSGVFIHERNLNRFDVHRFEGWWGHEKESRFKMPDQFIPLRTAEAWQLSNPPILSMASLLASLEIFGEVGMDKLRSKSEKLTAFLEKLINEKLNDKIKIITPSSVKNRGCQLSLKLLQPNYKIVKLLFEVGVICDWREPDIIRVAPVPLYNSFQDCYYFVEKLIAVINEYEN